MRVGQDVSYTMAYARAMAGHMRAKDASQAKVAAAQAAAEAAERQRSPSAAEKQSKHSHTSPNPTNATLPA
jgi:hypothetical protein